MIITNIGDNMPVSCRTKFDGLQVIERCLHHLVASAWLIGNERIGRTSESTLQVSTVLNRLSVVMRLFSHHATCELPTYISCYSQGVH